MSLCLKLILILRPHNGQNQKVVVPTRQDKTQLLPTVGWWLSEQLNIPHKHSISKKDSFNGGEEARNVIRPQLEVLAKIKQQRLAAPKEPSSNKSRKCEVLKCLMLGSSGGFLWTWWWIFRSHNRTSVITRQLSTVQGSVCKHLAFHICSLSFAWRF